MQGAESEVMNVNSPYTGPNIALSKPKRQISSVHSIGTLLGNILFY